jgi:Flp pilus assembly protein TadD
MAALSNLLATTSQAAGEFDVALDTNLKLLQQTPESPEVLLRLGALYRQRGDLTNAIRYLEKAAKLDPKSPQAQALLGEALAEAGKPNEAIAAYRAALQLAPEDPVALNNLAFQLADSGKNLDEALTLTKKAMDRLPNNPALMDTLGWIYFRRGDDQSAIQTLRASLAKDPDNALVRMHLVRLRMNRGELAEAKSEIANALSRKLSDRERKDFQQMEKDLAGRR